MPEQESVKIRYIFNDDYNPVYVDGIYGGPTPNGTLTVNFFFERKAVPRKETYEVNEDGKLGQRLEVEPSSNDMDFVRFISTGIIINAETAMVMRDWLNTWIGRMGVENDGELPGDLDADAEVAEEAL